MAVPTASEDTSGALRGSTTARPRAIITTVMLVAFALLAFLPGQFQISPTDRDESRYAQASRQMMETGNYLDIRFQDTPRYLQPIGIYWLQVAAAKLSGYGARAPIGIHRLPSLLGATAAVALTYWAVLPLVGATGALIAALLMASCVLLGVEARLAKTDAVLLAATLGAMGVLARAYMGQPLSLPAAMVFWIAFAGGFLVKGPLIVLVVGSTTIALIALDRSAAWLRQLRPALGVCLLLLLILPWFMAIAFISGGKFFSIALGHSMMGKVAVGQQGHGAPPGTYLLLFWVTFAPAAILAIIAAPWVWKHKSERRVRFCLAWIVPTWLAFELIVTKLPHYVLPVYPAIAALIALALLDGRRLGPWTGSVLIAGTILFVIAAVGLLYALEGIISPAVIGLFAAGVAIIVWAVHNEPAIAPLTFVAAVATASVINLGTVFGLIVPKLQTVWLSPRIAAAVKRHATCPDPKVVAAGYHEPSLVFLVGTRTRLVSPTEAAQLFAADGGCGIAIVTKDQEPAFMTELANRGGTAVLAERLNGINLGKFGQRSIGVFRPAAR